MKTELGTAAAGATAGAAASSVVGGIGLAACGTAVGIGAAPVVVAGACIAVTGSKFVQAVMSHKNRCKVAKQIWEKTGRPQGSATQHWLRAADVIEAERFRKLIARRMWEKEGRPLGKSKEHWLRAGEKIKAVDPDLVLD